MDILHNRDFLVIKVKGQINTRSRQCLDSLFFVGVLSIVFPQILSSLHVATHLMNEEGVSLP